MKVSFLLFFLCVCSVKANDVYSQTTNISLKVNKASLKQIFSKIEQQTDYVFIISDEVGPELNRINANLNASDENITEILDKVLSDTGINYHVVGRQISVFKGQAKNSEQSVQTPAEDKIRITGQITDEKGEPLIGVSVTVKGTTNGVVTDLDGVYSISIPNNKTILEFRYIGFVTKEETVGNRRILNIVMTETVSELDEVVVVGFGTQKKASVVGSITTIEPQRLQGSTRAVSNNLAGQLAGVIGVQRSGEPGNDGSHFWIRGISTFQNNSRSPLILVDGIERTLDDMDPAEIESFSVLKDAAASAVYGVRGANGVILINTKRGNIGKPTVNVHFEQGFTKPVKLPKYIGSADYLSLVDEIRADNGEAPLYGPELIAKYRDRVDPELYPDVNWVDAISKDHASNHRANITVSGGSNTLRYAVVGSYYGENGILVRDKSLSWDPSLRLNKYNLRSNVDVNITPTTLLRIGVGGYLQEKVAPRASVNDLFDRAFETPPYVHPTIYSTGEIPTLKNRSNPWAQATQEGFSRSSSSKIESTFGLEQDLKFILPGLKIKGIFSFDRYSNSWVERFKDLALYSPATERNEDGSLKLEAPFQRGKDFLSTEKKQDWGNKSTYFEGNITYNHMFDKHNVDAMFLYNQRDYDDGDAVPYRHQGIAGRFSYSYDYRYIAEFNFGYNGSENFAKDHRFGFFPSFALGWYLSEEPFMEPFRKTFSKIKFRGSYGLVGNDNLDGRRFAYISTIQQMDNGYRWGTNNDYERKGFREGDFGILNLKWETVEKMNIGVELGLWNELDLQVDYFSEHRKDIFMRRNTIPTAAGFINTPWANFGKVDNKGVDISLDYHKRINDDWHLNVRGSVTYAVNEIIEKDEAPGVIGTHRAETGRPVGQLFGLVAERLFTEEDFEDVATGKLKEGIANQTFTNMLRPGDIKYVDVDGDGVITPKDKKAIGGTWDPQLIYGFGANVGFKNWDFSFFFQGNGRTYRFIGDANFLPSANGLGNFLTNYDDRWTVDNPSQDVFYPRASLSRNDNNNQQSTWWLRNMSMLRMKDVELGYSLPKKWMEKVGVANMRLYLRGNNLLTISDFKLWDPEVDTATGAKYPIMKSISLGFDINF
ncbi:TonB-dependent receptor [Prevotella sp. 10(H)]|uniref:SusC/RagA family TonB-linked outer membrane protein n=1 Tax=Prevotella sp. 10(H) TaxID=1158294 RepID=UPI0009DF512C|nr:TonB-dependent receptor [Prevotella sp. 10(H)]